MCTSFLGWQRRVSPHGEQEKDEFVKFRWLEAEEEGEDTFFELRIRVDDLTGENSLIVTDFADDDELKTPRTCGTPKSTSFAACYC